MNIKNLFSSNYDDDVTTSDSFSETVKTLIIMLLVIVAIAGFMFISKIF